MREINRQAASVDNIYWFLFTYLFKKCLKFDRIKGVVTGNREGNTCNKHPAKEAASLGWKQGQS